MDTARIAALLQPFLRAIPNPCQSEAANAGEESAVLSTAQLQSISTYIDILLRWNSRINLTAIRDPEEIVLRHFGESLFAARNLLPVENHVGTAALGCPAEQSSAAAGAIESAGDGKASRRTDIPNLSRLPNACPELSDTITARVADLGSGAGFPGIPFKLWAPKILLTLIESNQKKATFLREVVRTLALTNVNIKNARAESVTETFDLVTLRAVEDFASILPTAAALVAPGGCLGLLIGSAQIEPARASLPHFSWSEAVPIPYSRSRVVLAGSRPR
jgi:16S rRNA (guanine527-N7)-methyltransferase